MDLGCASTPVNEHFVRRLIPNQIRVRRPLTLGADPWAGPGGTDFRSEVLPTPQFDCELPATLFKSLMTAKIKECLLSLKEQTSVVYHLKRSVAPSFILDSELDSPACIKEYLPQIPIPREIIYQAPTDSSENARRNLNCYSTRLDLEANEWMGARLPTHRVDLKVWFPLPSPPKSDEELFRYLVTWAITPLWNEQSQGLKAKVLPNHLCKKCIGEKEWLMGNEPEIIFWPY